MTSIEFKLNFLRPALAEGAELVARSRFVKRGRQVAVCDVEVRQRGRVVARGLFTYLILTPASPPASRTAWDRPPG